MGNNSKQLNIFLFIGAAFVLVIFASIYCNIEASPDASGPTISFLDVGQADATLINLGDSTQMLVDAGRDAEAANQVEKAMPKFDKKIEYLVLTHPDSDHIGGALSVIGSYEIGEVIKTDFKSTSATYERLMKEVETKKIPVEIADEGKIYTLNSKAKAKVLWPKESAIGSLTSNNSSIVMQIDIGGSKVILTGDAEIEAQNNILADFSADQLRSDLYKVPHHGSGGALNKKFLSEIGPKFAVISVGPNSYGHPAATVIEALTVNAAQVLRTDREKTIKFVASGGGWAR